jgi:hypothetical protein
MIEGASAMRRSALSVAGPRPAAAPATFDRLRGEEHPGFSAIKFVSTCKIYISKDEKSQMNVRRVNTFVKYKSIVRIVFLK